MDKNSEVDVCMCNGFVYDTSGTQRVMLPDSNDCEIFVTKSAMLNLVDTQRMIFLWAKIFRYSAMKNLNLDESLHVGEDRFFNWQFFQQLRKAGIISYRGYHHLSNPTGLSARNNFEESRYPYDLLKSSVKIYDERGEDEIAKRVATQNLLSISIGRLFRVLTQDRFEAKPADVEPYLKFLAKHKGEIVATIQLTAVQKNLLDILSQPFDKARAGCRELYENFLTDMKNFCETYDEIFIYGTGYFGVEIAAQLNAMDCSQCNFLTSNLSAGAANYVKVDSTEKKVIALPMLNSDPDMTGIILAMNAKNSRQVIPNLKLRGYTNIFDANKLGIHL